MKSITINEWCDKCDFENTLSIKQSKINGVSTCQCCGEELILCSMCSNDNCGSCTNGSQFILTQIEN